MSGDKHPPPKYIFKFLKNYSIDIIIIYIKVSVPPNLERYLRPSDNAYMAIQSS